jgi:chromosome segregation ATPase
MSLNNNPVLLIKRESYENEINQLRKQVKQLELDSKKLEIDYSLKCDEASRLQRSLSEIDELREKCITCEQKLDYQVKTNKTMQEKLYQLQLELVSKMPNQPQQIIPSATDASYESIIDDLKFIIHQQIAYRNPSPLADVEELKHKVYIFIR